MRYLLLLTIAGWLLTSCNNNSETTAAKTFCDTTCATDSFEFTGKHKLKPYVLITVENCYADTLTWSHTAMTVARQMHMGTLFGNPIRLNKAAIECYIKDTSYAWLSFNDCATGRGYLMQLPFNKKESIRKMASAINSFDKKFVVPQELRAYCDYSTIYVEDINTGKKEQMSFKEEYKINWNDIHQTIDSVNISRNRIYVQLLKNGEKVPMEKQISL